MYPCPSPIGPGPYSTTLPLTEESFSLNPNHWTVYPLPLQHIQKLSKWFSIISFKFSLIFAHIPYPHWNLCIVFFCIR